MTRTVVISGSRDTAHRPAHEYAALFAEFLTPFVHDEGLAIVGGAKGIDTLALTWLVQESSARILIAVPGTVAGQPSEAQDAIGDAEQHPARVNVVELQHPGFPSAAAYHARNRFMVDRADLLVAFPRGDDAQSGTWYTIRYAAEQGLPRIIVPI